MSMSDEDQGVIDTQDADNTPSPPVTGSGGAPEDDATGVNEAQAAQQNAPAGPPPSPGADGGPLNPMNVPGNAKRIIAYLMGADAAPPPTIDQYGQQVDPQGRMSPADRNLLAIQHAREQGGDNAAWALMQSNRVAYNAQTAFAKTALEGTQQKPADINAAVEAANKAQANVLDGSDVHFTAHGHVGVTAAVKIPGSSQIQTYNLSPQQFSQFLQVGGDGQWDKIMEHSAPATIARIAQSGGQRQARPPQGPTTGRTLASPGAASNTTRPQAQGTPEGPEAPESADQQQAKYDAMQNSAPPSEAVRTGKPIARDVTEGDQAPIPGTHDANGHYIGPKEPDRTNYGDELEARSRKIFPAVGQEGERQAWMNQQEEKEAERGNKVDVAAEVGRRREEVARINSKSRENVAQTNAENKRQGWQYRDQTKLAIAQAQIAQKVQQMQNANANAQQTREVKLIQSKLNTGGTLTEREQSYVDTLPGAAQEGADVTRSGQQQAQPQQQAPQQQAQPQQQQQARQQQAVPPANQRVVGQTYTTSKGQFKWMGNGWQPVN